MVPRSAGAIASTTPATLAEPKSMIFTVPAASIMMLFGRRS
jgi:hypothetical protein